MNDIIQGTDAWHEIRRGKVTASRIADLMAKTKTGWSTSRANYMADLIAERLTGVTAESYTNAAMQWGIDKEPDARAAYEFRTDATVEPIGFVVHPFIADSGASPDGYVGSDGSIEIKAPNTATHIETLLGGKVPDKYIKQIQWQLACAKRKWCDFVSFDPRMPPNLSLFVQRINRDDGMIAEMEKEVMTFLSELEQKTEALRRLTA